MGLPGAMGGPSGPMGSVNPMVGQMADPMSDYARAMASAGGGVGGGGFGGGAPGSFGGMSGAAEQQQPPPPQQLPFDPMGQGGALGMGGLAMGVGDPGMPGAGGSGFPLPGMPQ